jgi:hypothetical protein
LAKHAITSFSYPLKEIDIVEEAEKLAKTDGKSLSQLILRLLKEEISQKKVKGSPNPLNIYSLVPEEKPFPGTLDQWIKRTDAIQLIKEVDADMAEHIGINMIVAARFKKTGVCRDVRVI